MKILITGGFGYVVTALIPMLKGHHITVVDNRMSGPRPDIKVNEWINKSILDDYMAEIVPNYEVVIHLAAIVGEPAVAIDPHFAFDMNVIGTDRIVDFMNKDARIVFTSTSSVYGNRPGEKVTEETQPLPLGPYAFHKLEGEYCIQDDIADHVILRPVTAFGITKRTRLDVLVNTLIYEGLTTGEIKLYEPNLIRPIIYVQDFARILKLAAFGIIERGVYNIGNPSLTMRKITLAAYIARLTNAKVVPVAGTSLDLRDYDIDFSKIINTGFVFTPLSIEIAVNEMKAVLDKIKDPEDYSTPAKVKAYIRSHNVI